ncbi:hypothetical protein CW304_05845 [Bacillus sp. UFRGS-B20]|nr:hypothetical protein CW304_05845 [Bacillus sp. UFRGS-B20]
MFAAVNSGLQLRKLFTRTNGQFRTHAEKKKLLSSRVRKPIENSKMGFGCKVSGADNLLMPFYRNAVTQFPGVNSLVYTKGRGVSIHRA